MIKAIVTDIEGTTSSISFVKDVLFPYARENLPAFIANKSDKPEIKALLAAVAEQSGLDFDIGAVVAQLIRWMDEDQKITQLKSLQGLIWEEGYQKGAFKGHIYPDAAYYLRQWHGYGLALYVYSSGSIHAQKLLFSHTEAGDLMPLFSGYFDTQTGAKKDPASYQAIASAINVPVANILFLSDIEEELDAAKSSGYITFLLDRDGSGSPYSGYPVAKDFSEIDQMLQTQANIS